MELEGKDEKEGSESRVARGRRCEVCELLGKEEKERRLDRVQMEGATGAHEFIRTSEMEEEIT